MKGKVFWLRLAITTAFLFLWTSLFYQQVVKGDKNQRLAQENRIKVINLPAPRGIVYDRRGQALVANTPAGREYLYPKVFSHVLGYVGQADQEELAEIKQQAQVDYSIFPEQELEILVGKMGIEKEYDQQLRGQDGGVLVETDAAGQVVREIKRYPPQTGQNIHLNLDLGLQKTADQLLDNQKGAIIATQPNGQVLALASSPGFNPNLFTLAGQKEDNSSKNSQLEQVLTSPARPMFNRATLGVYPPGSTFKIVTALAGLAEGEIDRQTEIEDTGEIKIGDYTFGNWYYYQYGKKEGWLNLVEAIKRSNDIFFYITGRRLGINKLADWASYLGLGQPLGIDLPAEAGGLVPTPEWKKEHKTEGWYLGDTFITAIGQGNLQLTPLQVNQLTQIVANQGKSCRPRLFKDKPADCLELEVSQTAIDLVKKGMVAACEEGGTAWPFFDFKPQTAGKTGTAEVSAEGEETHAWFTALAPANDPQIVVTVLLEKGGEGSSDAAPLAKEILNFWFKNSQEKENQEEKSD